MPWDWPAHCWDCLERVRQEARAHIFRSIVAPGSPASLRELNVAALVGSVRSRCHLTIEL
jgi:hypothetical protein